MSYDKNYNKIYATYGKDTEGIFEVKFIVEEENEK
jgi:hypothetical protein